MDETPIETLIENKNANPPEGDDNDSSSSLDLDENVAYQSLSESDSDDEFKKITHFSAETAFDILYNQLSYTKIFLDYDLQKELSLEIGVHVSHEHPWKTVKKELLEEYLTDSTVETENLKAKLSLFDGNDSVLLVGYHCPPGEDNAEDGVFIVYDEIESILIATELIKKLEIWKRFQVKRALNKKPRTIAPSRMDWNQRGSRRPKISVELQTSHIVAVQKEIKLSFRTSTDCRDGFLELIPSKSETFQNVHRRRISQGIQSAAQRVDRAQQTDPTFPTNAHTQYSYEIQNEGKEEDSTEDGKGSEAAEGTAVEEDKAPVADKQEGDHSEDEETLLYTEATSKHKPVAVSKQIKELIRTLEFNQIDMYRIEYQTIGQKEIPKFKVPFLEEIFCFADIGRTGNRRVSHIEWHPKYSGLFVATYTWDTLSTFIPSQDDPKVDAINKIILQPNYIFMWSLEDSLNPILSFESPREVSTVSFHPLDPSFLIGGLVNGQVIIWDLTEIVENLNEPDDCSSYREDMRKFLSWTTHSFKKDLVKRSAISCLEFSQTERITSIKWLNSNIFLSSTGEIRESSDPKQVHRYFVTSSMDGTVAFWNMADGSIPEEKVVAQSDEKKKTKQQKKKMQTPVPELKPLPRTKFAHFDRKFRPQFVVVMQEPISSFGINSARFLFQPNTTIKRSADLSKRITFKAEEVPYSLEREWTVEDEEEGAFQNNLITTTLSGDVTIVKWKSQETDPAAGLNRQEKLLLTPLPSVHDGPVVAMDKNSLMPLLILTIGQTTVAIWRSDFLHGPIYWQSRGAELTDCKWSLTRPSVFFLTRVDGCVEIWDLICSTQDPCLIETLSGGILTTVEQHKLPLNADLLAIGDYNSNVRIFKLPRTFSHFSKEDERLFVEQINKEVERKAKLRLWQEKWRDYNEDILRAQKKLEEKERTPSPAKQLLRASAGDGRSSKKTAKKDSSKNKLSVIEKSELKWQQMNMKRLMSIMTTIKDIDPKECDQKTLPIREQRAYSALKRAAIKKEFAKIGTDFAEMRSRILPIKEDIRDRKDVVAALVKETILSEHFNRNEFEDKLEKKLDLLAVDRPKLSLTEIKQRGRHTREILNKSSGGNFAHKERYEHFKKGRVGSSVSHLKSLATSPEKTMFSSDGDKNC